MGTRETAQRLGRNDSTADISLISKKMRFNGSGHGCAKPIRALRT